MKYPKVSSSKTIALLITAAGSSRRMGSTVKKEYRLVNGRPVLLHSLITFLRTGLIGEVVLTIPRGDQNTVESLLKNHLPPDLRHFLDRTTLVEGGETRQESVRLGLSAFREPHQLVLIHDGARPWVTVEVIMKVIEGTRLHGACIPVVSTPNAMKQISPDGGISVHLPRESTVGAHTPQGFLYEDILVGHRHAAEDGVSYIDDSEIYSRYTGRVFTVEGDRRNRKITFPEDIASDLEELREKLREQNREHAP